MSTPGPSVEAVGVVGSGAMGRGIAESTLRAGLTVLLHDTNQDALRAARKQIGSSLQRSVDKNQITALEAETWLDGLHTGGDLDDISQCDLIIEAVPEILDLKLNLLRQVELHVPPTAVIATNTSSIPITTLSAALEGKSRFLGLHFFNPVPRMRLVEIIPTILTSDQAVHIAEEFVRGQLQKTPLTIADRPGFAVNALLIPYLLSAARMLDNGYATAKDIDEGMKLGCGHPVGPLELADFIGLDVVCHVADSIYAETKDPANIAPNNLRRLVEAGHLGRKTGRGFHQHAEPAR
jgi:3-hydroxybutyryl-CoA dehydrogenase